MQKQEIESNSICRPQPDDRESVTRSLAANCGDPAIVDEILAYIERERDIDFCGFRRSTIRRRLENRMAAAGLPDSRRYLVLGDAEVLPAFPSEQYEQILLRLKIYRKK